MDNGSPQVFYFHLNLAYYVHIRSSVSRSDSSASWHTPNYHPPRIGLQTSHFPCPPPAWTLPANFESTVPARSPARRTLRPATNLYELRKVIFSLGKPISIRRHQNASGCGRCRCTEQGLIFLCFFPKWNTTAAFNPSNSVSLQSGERPV